MIFETKIKNRTCYRSGCSAKISNQPFNDKMQGFLRGFIAVAEKPCSDSPSKHHEFLKKQLYKSV